MVKDLRIIDILNNDEPIVEENLAYLKWFIDEITTENENLKEENKIANSRLREIKRLNKIFMESTEEVLSTVQIEINRILDWIEDEPND